MSGAQEKRRTQPVPAALQLCLPEGENRPPEPATFLEAMTRDVLQEVEVAGVILRPGCRVRLRPRPGGDLLDAALSGLTARIEAIEEDDTGSAHVAVIMEDDPGRGLGRTRHPAHRFFFAPGELEPLHENPEALPHPRVLVAGVGNLFLGDDGFGVVVAQRLLKRQLPKGVDFGIRGRDLAYALGGYDAAILVDAVPGAGQPGALVVMEVDQEHEMAAPLDGHRMDPLSVLGLARELAPLPGQLLVVGCHPELIGEQWRGETAMSLSAPVAAAVDRAADLVQQLVTRILADPARRELNGATKGVLS